MDYKNSYNNIVEYIQSGDYQKAEESRLKEASSDMEEFSRGLVRRPQKQAIDIEQEVSPATSPYDIYAPYFRELRALKEEHMAAKEASLAASSGSYDTSGISGDYVDVARKIAEEEGIDPDLFVRLVNQESRFNPNAVSPVGATGLAQLMPSTAKDLGVDPTKPEENLRGGARYLRQQLDTFGSVDLALAAYNAGPGNVKKYGGIPPFKETQNYVRKILGG